MVTVNVKNKPIKFSNKFIEGTIRMLNHLQKDEHNKGVFVDTHTLTWGSNGIEDSEYTFDSEIKWNNLEYPELNHVIFKLTYFVPLDITKDYPRIDMLWNEFCFFTSEFFSKDICNDTCKESVKNLDNKHIKILLPKIRIIDYIQMEKEVIESLKNNTEFVEKKI
jgi:hypothetical protein